MKTNYPTAAIPVTQLLDVRRLALVLAVGVTLLAMLALPARAEDQAAAPAKDTAADVGELPPVNHLVYLDQLPTPAALVKEAKAQGKTIERIDRTDDSIVVTYKLADGRTDTYGYTTLSAAGAEEAPAIAETAPAPVREVVVTEAPPPRRTYRVVSYEPAPVYYETRYYRDYDPFWVPLSLGIGLSWVSGGHGGHYHGGYRGGYHGPFRGGRHR